MRSGTISIGVVFVAATLSLATTFAVGNKLRSESTTVSSMVENQLNTPDNGTKKQADDDFYRKIFIPCMRMDYAHRPPLNAKPTQLFNCREDDGAFCICHGTRE